MRKGLARRVDRTSKKWNNTKCDACGKMFHRKPSLAKKSINNYCSKECRKMSRSAKMSGENNPQYGKKGEASAAWKNGRYKTRMGYILVQCPDHPFCQKTGVVLEHRLVAEKHFLTNENSVVVNGKRYLKPELIVHHKNHIKSDNRPENLEILSESEHQTMHSKEQHYTRDKATGRFISA